MSAPDNKPNYELEDRDIVRLNTADGVMECEFLDQVAYDGRTYAVLLTLAGQTDEVIVLRIEGENPDGSPRFASAQSDAEVEAVFERFLAANAEWFHRAE